MGKNFQEQYSVVIASTNKRKKQRILDLHSPFYRVEQDFVPPVVEEGDNEFLNSQEKAIRSAIESQLPAIGWDDALYFDEPILADMGAEIKRDADRELSNREVFERVLETLRGSEDIGELPKGKVRRVISLAFPNGRIYTTKVDVKVSFDISKPFNPNLINPLDAIIVPDGFEVPFSEFSSQEVDQYDQMLGGAIDSLFAEYERREKSETNDPNDPYRSIEDNDLVYVFSNSNLRLFVPEDAQAIGEMTQVLGKHYDGHPKDINWVVEKYGTTDGQGEDPYGFFSRKRVLIVNGEVGKPVAMLAYVFKRGGAVKTNTLRVKSSYQGKGIGRDIKEEALAAMEALGARKAYCTTGRKNNAALMVNLGLGYVIEGDLMSQYRPGEVEVILGKMILSLEPQELPDDKSMLKRSESKTFVSLDILTGESDQSVIAKVKDYIEHNLSGWHDEITDGTGFFENILKGADRGVEDVLNKGKLILYCRNQEGEITGVGVITLKMGGASKLYPMIGDEESMRMIIERAKNEVRKLESHKVYSFVPTADEKALEVVSGLGMRPDSDQTIIQEPYKPGYDLIPVSLFLE